MAKSNRYLVVHPKLTMRVNDKLQRVEVGTHIILSDEQALTEDGEIKPSLKGKIEVFKQPKTIDAQPKKDDAPAK